MLRRNKVGFVIPTIILSASFLLVRTGRFSLPSEVLPMLLHRRIALALAHLRAARYDGCASDIKRAERRLNGLLDELPRCPTGNARMEC